VYLDMGAKNGNGYLEARCAFGSEDDALGSA
jgi:hypothetical protein